MGGRLHSVAEERKKKVRLYTRRKSNCIVGHIIIEVPAEEFNESGRRLGGVTNLIHSIFPHSFPLAYLRAPFWVLIIFIFGQGSYLLRHLLLCLLTIFSCVLRFYSACCLSICFTTSMLLMVHPECWALYCFIPLTLTRFTSPYIFETLVWGLTSLSQQKWPKQILLDLPSLKRITQRCLPRVSSKFLTCLDFDIFLISTPSLNSIIVWWIAWSIRILPITLRLFPRCVRPASSSLHPQLQTKKASPHGSFKQNGRIARLSFWLLFLPGKKGFSRIRKTLLCVGR